MDRNERDGLIYLTAAVIGYSFLPIISKLILDTGMHPLDVAMWRFIIAVPSIWLLIRVLNVPKPAQPLPRLRVVGLGFFLGIAAITVFFGLQYIPPGTYTVLFYTHPTIIALMVVLLGERLPGITWVALGLTLVGVVLTVPDLQESASGLSNGNLIGVIFALANAFAVSVYFIANERVLRGRTGLARASGYVLTGALLTILAAQLIRGEVHLPPENAIILLLALALVCTVLPVFSLINGIQKLGSPRASILSTIEPVLTLVLSMLLLDERLLPLQWIGSGLIIGSVILLQVWQYVRPQMGKVKAPVIGD